MARESVHAERQERSDEIKTPRNQGHSLSSSSAHEELDVQRERERERERERGRAGCEAPREILFHLRRAGRRLAAVLRGAVPAWEELRRRVTTE